MWDLCGNAAAGLYFQRYEKNIYVYPNRIMSTCQYAGNPSLDCFDDQFTTDLFFLDFAKVPVNFDLVVSEVIDYNGLIKEHLIEDMSIIK